MASTRKSTTKDLPLKSVDPRNAESVKGGAKAGARKAASSQTSKRRPNRLGANHNQTLR